MKKAERKNIPRLPWRTILRQYWMFARESRRRIVLMLAAYAVGALIVSVVSPLLYKGIVDAIVVRTDATIARVDLLFLGIVGALIVLTVAFRTGDYLLIRLESDVMKRLYDHVLEVLAQKSYTFFSNAFTGGLVAKTKRFVRAYEVLCDQLVFQVWMNGIELIASVGVLLYLSPILGSIFLVWFLLHVVLVRFMVRWALPKNVQAAEADSRVTAVLADTLTNILTVKMFGAHDREQEAFAQVTAEEGAKRRAAWMQGVFWNSSFQALSISGFELAMMFGVITLWRDGRADAGLVLIVVMYVSHSFSIVWNMSRNVLSVFTALTDAREMVELLEEPPSVRDPVAPEAVRFARGEIVFSGVTHAYEGAHAVFSELNLTVRAGERVALVGHSGAGKTTFVKLLLRFVDIGAGTITIDGQDITTLRQDDLRAHISYVPQDAILFHRSLFENIAYGKVGASPGAVRDAARRAHAHEFIMRLPEGYDTLVGERGVKLSGGERQRIAIARALLKDAPIVVLDEATSSLDSVSEGYIQEAFRELMEGRTTIVIAHRLSTIRHMDRIIVLDHGAVVEEGTHDTLIARGGVYAGLWSSQVGGFLADDAVAKEQPAADACLREAA